MVDAPSTMARPRVKRVSLTSLTALAPVGYTPTEELIMYLSHYTTAKYYRPVFNYLWIIKRAIRPFCPLVGLESSVNFFPVVYNFSHW